MWMGICRFDLVISTMNFRLVEKETSASTEKADEEDTDDAETGTITESIAEEEVEIVTSSLEEITKVYVNAEHLIVSQCVFVKCKSISCKM